MIVETERFELDSNILNPTHSQATTKRTAIISFHLPTIPHIPFPPISYPHHLTSIYNSLSLTQNKTGTKHKSNEEDNEVDEGSKRYDIR